MRQNGLTFIECVVTVAIVLILFTSATPLLSWYTHHQEALTLQQLEAMLQHARAQAFLRETYVQLLPLAPGRNWSLGAQLIDRTAPYTVLHEWHFPSPQHIQITWHGFQKEGVWIAPQLQHQAMNGYFLIETPGACLKKIIVNRLGYTREASCLSRQGL